MNYKNKIKENRHLRTLFRHQYPEGTVKWSNTSILHFKTLAEVFYWFKANGYEVWSEVVFLNGSRGDIVAIKDQFGYIVEILCSETDKRYNKKLETYPIEFEMIKVNAKDFKYEDFKI